MFFIALNNDNFSKGVKVSEVIPFILSLIDSKTALLFGVTIYFLNIELLILLEHLKPIFVRVSRT